jgi:hypothetical protein
VNGGRRRRFRVSPAPGDYFLQTDGVEDPHEFVAILGSDALDRLHLQLRFANLVQREVRVVRLALVLGLKRLQIAKCQPHAGTKRSRPAGPLAVHRSSPLPARRGGLAAPTAKTGSKPALRRRAQRGCNLSSRPGCWGCFTVGVAFLLDRRGSAPDTHAEFRQASHGQAETTVGVKRVHFLVQERSCRPGTPSCSGPRFGLHSGFALVGQPLNSPRIFMDAGSDVRLKGRVG